jgi:hypothetical protein
VLLLFLISISSAEERIIKYQRETEIDFDAIDITGEMVKPQGSLIMERQSTNFNPLIKLRTDWNQEINDSVRSIK